MTHLNYVTAKNLIWLTQFFPIKMKHKVTIPLIFLSPSVIHFLVHIFNTEADFLRTICFSGAQK